MAEAVQLAGVVIGGAIGGPVGAAIGGAIGGAVGQELFPAPPLRGPRLEELRVSGSTVGSVIAQVYGEQRVGGQVIWMDEIREVSNKKSSGGLFGVGGQTSITYSYFADFAVGFAEGEIGAVRKIWFDGKLVYSNGQDLQAVAQQTLDEFDPEDPDSIIEFTRAALQQANLRRAANEALEVKFDFYPGSEDQMPDPTIEAAVGAGNASAYRGLCYIVFKNIEITDTRRIPNVNVELIKKPEIEDNTFDLFEAQAVYPWIEGTNDPRNLKNDHEYRFFGAEWRTSLEQAIEDLNASISAEDGPGKDVLPSIVGWTVRDFGSAMSPYSENLPIAAGKDTVTMHFGRFEEYQIYADLIQFAETTCTQVGFMVPFPDLGVPFLWVDPPVSIIGPPWWAYIENGGADGPPNLDDFGPIQTCNIDFTGQGTQKSIRRIQTGRIDVRRVPRCRESDCDDSTFPLSEAPGFCATPDGTLMSDNMYTLVTGEFLQLQAFAPGIDGSGPVLSISDPRFDALNTEEFWVSAYNAAVSDRPGGVPPGWVYGEDYPVLVTEACRKQDGGPIITALPTTLEEVVRAICIKHQLSLDNIDTTGLREIAAGELTEQHVFITGYSIRSAISGRDQIEQLRTFGFFDAVESDGKLKFVRRGLSAVTEIGADELGAYDNSRPPAISIESQQNVELPREVRLHYTAPIRNYQPAEQRASRVTRIAANVSDITLSIAMSDTKALQIAEVALYDAWTERTRYSTSISNKFMRLEPTDCLSVPVEGQTERLRIVSIDHALPGLLSLSLVRDDDGIYVSDAVAVEAPLPPPPPPALRGPTELTLLDLPPLADADVNDAGYYAAVRGLLPGWEGAVAHRSGDAGETYEPELPFLAPATVARATTTLATGPSTILDAGNVLDIELFSGELQSITRTALYAGGNLAALASGDGWEVIQFETVTQLTATIYRLSKLLRGRLGTEHAIAGHAVGDRLVMLADVNRLSLSESLINVELLHKPVSIGTALDATEAQAFTPGGEVLRPWSPANLIAVYNDAGDIELTWQWRNRRGVEIRSGVMVPLTDVPEAGEVDVLIGGVVVRALPVSGPAATYTAAMQAADSFTTGSFRAYQINPTVGRGRPAEVTL